MNSNGKRPYKYGDRDSYQPDDGKSCYKNKNGRVDWEQFSREQTQETMDQIMSGLRHLSMEVGAEVGKRLDDAAERIRTSAEEVETKTARTTKTTGVKKNNTRATHKKTETLVPRNRYELTESLSDGKNSLLGVLSVCGAGISGAIGIISAACLAEGLSYAEYGNVGVFLVMTLGLLSLTAVLSVKAHHFLSLPAARKRSRRYLGAVGSEQYVPLVRLAEAVQQPISFVKKDISRMIRNGLLPNAYLDDEEELFFVSAEKYRSLQRRQEAQKRLESAPVGAQTQRDEMLLQMQDFLVLLDEHIQATSDTPEIWAKLKQMRQSAEGILEWTRVHPDGLGRVRRFGSYYMPTTLKLLRTYDDMKGQQNKEADQIRSQISGILDSLNTGFRNLHSSLLNSAALDISGEISALHTMMAQDGMTDPIFDSKE